MRQLIRDHAAIQTWAEARGGRPARVKGSAVLRVAFERLPPNWEAISWEEFFAIFDRSGLWFWYEDAPGSRICKLTRGERPGPISRAD